MICVISKKSNLYIYIYMCVCIYIYIAVIFFGVIFFVDNDCLHFVFIGNYSFLKNKHFYVYYLG